MRFSACIQRRGEARGEGAPACVCPGLAASGVLRTAADTVGGRVKADGIDLRLTRFGVAGGVRETRSRACTCKLKPQAGPVGG